MTLSNPDREEIRCTLEMCGVSRFNILVHDDGLVIFYSNGLSATEVEMARWMLVKYLCSVTKGNA